MEIHHDRLKTIDESILVRRLSDSQGEILIVDLRVLVEIKLDLSALARKLAHEILGHASHDVGHVWMRTEVADYAIRPGADDASGHNLVDGRGRYGRRAVRRAVLWGRFVHEPPKLGDLGLKPMHPLVQSLHVDGHVSLPR